MSVRHPSHLPYDGVFRRVRAIPCNEVDRTIRQAISHVRVWFLVAQHRTPPLKAHHLPGFQTLEYYGS